MKKFQLSFQARKINAIGIVYNNSATVVADNLQEVSNRGRNQYQTEK